MKTTLDLNDRVLRDAKKLAAERGITLTSFIENALILALEPKRASYNLKLPVWDDPEALPFDPADRRAMYEWFDQNA